MCDMSATRRDVYHSGVEGQGTSTLYSGFDSTRDSRSTQLNGPWNMTH